MKSTTLQRREFLKYAGILGTLPFVSNLTGTGKLLASGKVANFGKDLVVNGDVLTAAHWGALRVTMKNGKVVKSTRYFTKINNIYNPLQHYTADMVYRTRISYPMIRKSYYENFYKNPSGIRGDLRGRDEWVRVPFDVAIKYAADSIKRVVNKYGNEGIYGGSYGWQSAAKLHSASTLLKRFLGTIGGFTDGIGDFSTGAGQVICAHVLGTLEVYEQQTSWNLVLKDTKNVVIWGMNPFATNRLAYSPSDETGLMNFKKLADAQRAGKINIIYIDPVYNETAKFLKVKRDKHHHIQLTQQTDVPFMLGMAYHMIKTGKYDKAFLETYTTGFDKFEAYVLGKSDGVAKTPEWASKICGISPQVIKDTALTLYGARTMLMSGWCIQRQDHGEQPYWMVITLACMIGQIGLSGGGFGFSYHTYNGGNPTCTAPVVGGMGTHCNIAPSGKWGSRKPVSSAIPVVRVPDCILNPGKVIEYNGHTIKYPKIGMIYWSGGNPVNQQQNLNKNLKAWRKVDTVIVNDPYWTASARMADIVFPITTSYERNDIAMTGEYSNSFIVPMKQCVEPWRESIDDYDVFYALSKEFGTGDAFSDKNKSKEAWLRGFYAQALEQAKPMLLTLPDFDKFWSDNKALPFVASEESKNFIRYKEFRDDPILSPLGTPSGLIEIYSEEIAAMKYKDCPGHPTWMEPYEWQGNKTAEAPFSMVSPHPRYRLHSQMGNATLRKKYAINGRDPIWINNKDAKRLGIKNGDVVRVFNKRGQVLAGAKVTKDIKSGTVRLTEGAWYTPDDRDKRRDGTMCINGNPNPLTTDRPASKLSNGNMANTALVNIEKYKEKAPRVYVFDEIKPSKIVGKKA